MYLIWKAFPCHTYENTYVFWVKKMKLRKNSYVALEGGRVK